VVNPPWTLRADMQQVLPYLATTLGQGGRGRHGIEQWVNE
jgi:23S rRNA (adenine2030-N6)-methyltransferase